MTHNITDSISFEKIISIENLLIAWKEFLKGKKNRKDVQEFQLYLMDNIIDLHIDLKNKTYNHGGYLAFNISDPKPRNIHKASVRDRLLHHAIYRILYSYFDKKFVNDSYSCRNNKGTHKAMDRFNSFARKVSKNWTKQCWVLKCDIRKFFASIDQSIMIEILNKHIKDEDIIWLLERVIESFSSTEKDKGISMNTYASGNPDAKGLPLGNLTSQLLVNIYMNEFDQFVKHKLKTKYYIRYADDFVFLSQNKSELQVILPQISLFLTEKLRLNLHPNKVFTKTFSSGIDFLGFVHFPKHRVLRTATKKKMLRKLAENPEPETVQSYLGLLSHGNTFKLRNKIYF